MTQVSRKTCDDEFTLPSGEKVSGCPWNRYIKLSVGSCQNICDESFHDWFPRFVTAVYNEIFLPSAKSEDDYNRNVLRLNFSKYYNMYFFAIPEGSNGFNPGIFFRISTEKGLKLQILDQIEESPNINPNTLTSFTEKFVQAAYEETTEHEDISISICMDIGHSELKHTFNFPMENVYYFPDGDPYKNVMVKASKVYNPISHGLVLRGCEIAIIHKVQEWEQKESYRDDMSKFPGTFQIQVGQQMKDAGLKVHESGNIAEQTIEPPLKKSKNFKKSSVE